MTTHMTNASRSRMLLAATLITPWRTVHRSLRWLGDVVRLVLTGMFALVSANTFVPLFATLGRRVQSMEAATMLSLALAWVVAALALAWFGWCGRQGMRQRPHPFLAN